MRRAFVILGLVLAAAGVFVWRYANRPVPLPPPPVAKAPEPPAIVTPRPQAPAYRAGERIGEIAIPRLKLSVPVFEGDDDATLKLGAGHVPQTHCPASRETSASRRIATSFSVLCVS